LVIVIILRWARVFKVAYALIFVEEGTIYVVFILEIRKSVFAYFALDSQTLTPQVYRDATTTSAPIAYAN